MKRVNLINGFIFIVSLFYLMNFSFAQETPPQCSLREVPGVLVPELKANKGDKFTLALNETDILDVLKLIASKSGGMNIVTTPEVSGTTSVNLVDVTWDKALDSVLEMNNLGYQKNGNIITVAPLEKIAFFKKQNLNLTTEVFNLKYLDAELTRKTLLQLLSPQGKISILQVKNEGGWAFAGGKGESFSNSQKKADQSTSVRSNTLVITDTPEAIEKISGVIKKIDIRPIQILIETRIIEVKKDKLKDMGLDWGTGSSGAESSTVTQTTISSKGNSVGSIGGHSLNSQTSPFGFFPVGGSTGTAISPTSPFNLGSQLVYQKLKGTQFEIVAHTLEENAQANTLSAPRILALNNQEATILIGTKYPILQSNITGAGSVGVTTVTLDYYQDIGIQLKVIPQVGLNGDINMVIHPAVTSYTETVGDNKYPVILTREAETRIVMENGETVVIGGLLSDRKIKSISGIPILMKLPIIGKLFRRETTDTDKLDLLIFITAKIVKENTSFADDIDKIERKFIKD